MANIDENGLTLNTKQELLDELISSFQSIYGADINVGSNSPDGQSLDIYAQGNLDQQEFAKEVYNSFDPDTASGSVLDSRCGWNGVVRKAGTRTTQEVEITTDRALTLTGGEYTVVDDEGNNFILLSTEVFATAGTKSLIFQAENIGKIETLPNTITTPVTIVLGVTNINNPSGALTVGEDEEDDVALRIRRSKSVSNASIGYEDGLVGTLLALDDLIDVKVYQNRTNSTDSRGIPGHSIWVIVDGGQDEDIADIMSKKVNDGAGMKGTETYDVDVPGGEVFTAQFDRVTGEDLHIKFDIQPTIDSPVFDQNAIKQYIVDNKTYAISEFAETSSLTCICKEAIESTGGGGVPVNVEISDDGISWYDYLEPSDLDKKFTLDVGDITIAVL